MLTMRVGILTSLSYVSLRVISNQNIPAKVKKNKKIRNSLFTELNKKFLILPDMCLMSITR